MHWNLKKRKYMASEKKDAKAFTRQRAYCMFFMCALLLWLKTRKQKQGREEMIQEAVRKTWKNLVVIIVAFLSGLYLIGLNMAFRHLQNIYQENF